MAEDQPMQDAEKALVPEGSDENIPVVTVSTKPGAADFNSISTAINSAQGDVGLRVVVEGGVYEESVLDLKKGIQIVAADGCGTGSATPVVITAKADHPAVCSRVGGALLRDVRIEHQGPFCSMACVVIEAGDVKFERCVVTGSVSIGVLICGAATPTLSGCEILLCCGDGIKVADCARPEVHSCSVHDNDGFGIFCTGTSGGSFSKNKVFANSNAGVAARGTCFGSFQYNKVYDGKQGGFWLEEEARCELIGNDIYQNQKSGIQVGGYADPMVQKNIVRDGLKGGIVVHDHATGHFLSNEIMRNVMAGVGGTDSACPLFHSNLVKDGRGGGIVLHENCRGVFEKNQVIGNTHAGIGLKGASNALFDGNYVSDGSGYGVWIQERAVSTLQNNVIERNMRAGVVVTDGADPVLACNIIRDGKHAGLLIRHNATGRFRQNTLSHNAHGNVVLLEQAASELVANIISHGALGGIIIRGTTSVTVRGNTICHNDGANIAVLDNSNPTVDGNVLTNGAGRGLVIMDKATGLYRFNMIRNSELAGVYVGRQSSPELIANCVCDGKAAGILFEDEAQGRFTYNIVCANQNEGVAVHGKAHPTMECNVVLQGGHGGIWLDANAAGTFRGNVVEDSGTNAYRCGTTTTANEWRLAERNTNTAPAALAEVLSEWAEEKMRTPGANKKVILVQNPDTDSPGGGVAMATQCSELLGLDPSRSCMLVARFLGDAGQFEDAEELITITKGFIGENGPFKMEPAMRSQQWADMSLHCAELLNKWAAASQEYSRDLMTRAADYARSAAEVFSQQPQYRTTVEGFASALYWVGLNFATLVRLGGGSQWSAQQAAEVAEEALQVAHSMVAPDTPPHRVAELFFVDGVLSFCKAEAVLSKFIDDQGRPEELMQELLQKSLQTMETAYSRWCEAYGEKHLQTVKAITMIGLLQGKLHGKEASIEWYRRELRIREELQGELHPRTQQARRTYTSMIDERLNTNMPDTQVLNEAIAASKAASVENSTVVVARFLSEAGQFKNAEVILRESQEAASEAAAGQPEAAAAGRAEGLKAKSGPEYVRWGEISLYCAELLNKWAASSPEYSKDIMIRAAEYAVDAVEVFSNLMTMEENDTNERKYAEGLYWMGLNFATLCRLGGGGKWSTQQAYDVANSSLSDCQKLRVTAPDERRAEVIFAQGVLCFCKAEAVLSGFLRSTKMDKEQLVERKYMQALQLFEHANQLWTGVYGEKHLETVKAITMIGTLLHRLQGAQAGMEWYRKELKIREELQGEMHPRTQQARRMYTSLLDAKLQAERRAGGPQNQPGVVRGGSAASQSQMSAAAAAAGVAGPSSAPSPMAVDGQAPQFPR